jgi:AcrR family transcriptional regulator
VETPEGLAEGNLHRAAVSLPAGMAINPGGATGLAACAEEQFGLHNANAVVCPEASKVGVAEAVSPALQQPLTGSVYVAQQNSNPFGSLLALYMVLQGEGALIKQAGEVHLDPVSGQITTTFAEVPQQPLSDFKLHVTEIQRMRVLTAMAEVAAERGAGQASVAHVVARAGVSRRTFYDLFEDREDCFLAAFEESLAKAAATVIPAYQRHEKRREQVRAGLLALLVFCEEQPALAQLCIAESLAAGPRALARREQVVDLLVGAVDRGRSERTAHTADPPPLAAEGAVGAVLAVVHPAAGGGVAVSAGAAAASGGGAFAVACVPAR